MESEREKKWCDSERKQSLFVLLPHCVLLLCFFITIIRVNQLFYLPKSICYAVFFPFRAHAHSVSCVFYSHVLVVQLKYTYFISVLHKKLQRCYFYKWMSDSNKHSKQWQNFQFHFIFISVFKQTIIRLLWCRWKKKISVCHFFCISVRIRSHFSCSDCVRLWMYRTVNVTWSADRKCSEHSQYNKP